MEFTICDFQFDKNGGADVILIFLLKWGGNGEELIPVSRFCHF